MGRNEMECFVELNTTTSATIASTVQHEDGNDSKDEDNVGRNKNWMYRKTTHTYIEH